MKNSVVKNSYFNVITLLFGKGTFLLFSVYGVWVLGLEGYGLVSYFNNTVLFIQSIATLGVAITVTKEVAAAPSEDKKLELASTAIYTVSAVYTLVATLFVVFFGGYDKDALVAFLVASYFSSLYIIVKAIVNGLDDFESPAKASLYNSISSILLLCILTYYFGVFGGYIAITLVYVSSTFFLFYCKKGFLFLAVCEMKSVEMNNVKSFIKNGQANFLSAVWVGFGFWLCLYLLERSSQEELGLHNLISQWFTICSFVPVMISQALLPRMSNLNYVHNLGRMLRASFGMLLFSSMMLILILLLSKYISVLYSYNDFQHFRDLLFISLLTALIISCQIVFDNFNVATGRSWSHCFLNFIWLLSLLIILYFTKSELSAKSILTAKLYAYLIRAFFQIIQISGVFYFKKNLG